MAGASLLYGPVQTALIERLRVRGRGTREGHHVVVSGWGARQGKRKDPEKKEVNGDAQMRRM